MQIPEPSPEHLWLSRLVGEWTIRGEYRMGPDQPTTETTGRESVRSLGKLWTIGEWFSGGDAAECDSIMTLGFDPRQGRFVGTFVTGAMTHLWPYVGTLDPESRRLTLDSEGPDFLGGEGMSRYQDIIEFQDDDHRTLTARVLGSDGEWRTFMTTHARRVRNDSNV